MMINRLIRRRILIGAAVALVLIVVLLSRGCGKGSEPVGTDSSAAQTVTESSAVTESDSSKAQDAETGTAEGTAAGAVNDAAGGEEQQGQENPGQNNEDAPEEETILENNGELEIIVPEGEETYGE